MAKQKTLIEGFWDRANKVMEGKNKNELARRIGCNRKTLYGNHGTLSPVYLARFCVLTGTDANWLLGVKGENRYDRTNNNAAGDEQQIL